ncbi:GHMP family kinase ATP-binding protein [Mesorhizobium caraganae]|uniref:GHMP family kinase ATP-binding protein n=1 Tax=Mesorhizobium caraganae TaxID=483206 RepID=UPI00333D74FC
MSIQNRTHSIGPVGSRSSITTAEIVKAAADEVWKPYMQHQTFDGEAEAEAIAEGGQQPGNHSGDGKALCCGTFGELLQGQLPINSHSRDSHFLITMPIALFSRAHFMPTAGDRYVTVYPPHKVKAKRLAENLVNALGVSGGTLLLQSELPEGKGLASSSADLVATARSIACCFNRRVQTSLIENLMAGIEPSDGVMYPGVVAYQQRSCRLLSFLGQMPPLAIVGIDEGGTVETVDYDQQRGEISANDRAQYQRLLDRARVAIPQGDTVTIGKITTASALLHQERAPKGHLNATLKASQETGALGIIIAHSGTMTGILLDRRAPDFLPKLRSVVDHVSPFDNSPKIYVSMN